VDGDPRTLPALRKGEGSRLTTYEKKPARGRRTGRYDQMEKPDLHPETIRSRDEESFNGMQLKELDGFGAAAARAFSWFGCLGNGGAPKGLPGILAYVEDPAGWMMAEVARGVQGSGERRKAVTTLAWRRWPTHTGMAFVVDFIGKEVWNAAPGMGAAVW
jgi:hypothetical protein